MEALINYLLQFGHLNQQQIDLVKSKAKEAELKKMTTFPKQVKFPEKLLI